ncbi:histidine kinase [bacterium BRH_c32]|nr:MAG: histidine kinase [bacterium BRH_c32]
MFLTSVISPALILYLLLIIIIPLSFLQSLSLFFLILILALLILYLIGRQHRKEISTIRNIINSIRNNKFSSTDEIKLGEYLVELEGEIKSMFFRTQNDIANLKKLEQVRTEFLGNVSHELRTPIFAIQGYLETLLDGAINDSKVNLNFLKKANHHTSNLSNLLNDLIDISMIESGQMKMSFRYFNVQEYLKSIIVELEPHAISKGLVLELHPINHNLQFFGDKEKLKQVLVNLIMNAIKYTEKGKVEILVTEEDKMGRITVKDSGIGIASQDLERIFERFYRVDKDRSREVGGTGLGLAIVKHIIEAHGSRISVSSTPGVGTEFSFSLKK